VVISYNYDLGLLPIVMVQRVYAYETKPSSIQQSAVGFLVAEAPASAPWLEMAMGKHGKLIGRNHRKTNEDS